MDLLTVNSAVTFNWHDEQGRILTLRCGHVDVAHPHGWYALYINNAMAYITDKEPEILGFDHLNLNAVIEWGEAVIRALLATWEGLPDAVK